MNETNTQSTSASVSDLLDDAITPELRKALYEHVDSEELTREASVLVHKAKTAFRQIITSGEHVNTPLAKKMIETGILGGSDEAREKAQLYYNAIHDVRDKIFTTEATHNNPLELTATGTFG